MKEGYPELAKIVLAHMLSATHEPELWDSWEKKLVNFADKQVVGDRTVGLEKRFEYLREKYPTIESLLDKVEPNYRMLQKQIFDLIGIKELVYNDFEIPQ